MKFHTWNVLKSFQKESGEKKHLSKYYLCKCDCGIEKEINAYNLESNKAAKCKCQISNHSVDITGKQFGYWTVLKYSFSKKSGKKFTSFWICQCKCGKIQEVAYGKLLRKNRIRSCGCSRQDRSKEIFESNYKKTSGCWIWEGNLNRGGYGKIGTTGLAHRRAYQYTYGKIPYGKQVCHKCDNRKCVNPDHLFLGSIGDNMKDKTFKDRQAKGSQIGSSKLTENEVREIRKRRELGETYESLSQAFDVDWYTIRSIIKRKSWNHI